MVEVIIRKRRGASERRGVDEIATYEVPARRLLPERGCDSRGLLRDRDLRAVYLADCRRYGGVVV